MCIRDRRRAGIRAAARPNWRPRPPGGSSTSPPGWARRSTSSTDVYKRQPFDDTDTTDAIGYSFFPRDATPFVAGTYDYTVSVAGFTDVTGQVTVSGGAIETESISMTAN